MDNQTRIENKKGQSMNPVLITTEFRGVFFGYVKNDKKLPEEITLTKARNCIYWPADCGGFPGSCRTRAERSMQDR